MLTFISFNTAVFAESGIGDEAKSIFEAAGTEDIGEGFTEKCLDSLENGFNMQFFEDSAKALLGFLKEEASSKLYCATELFICAAFCGIASGGGGMRKSLVTASKLACAFTAVRIVKESISVSFGSIGNLMETAEKLTPVSAALMMILGEMKSSEVMKPLLSMLTGGVTEVMGSVISPLISGITAMELADGVREEGRLTGISDFLSSALKWALGLVSTLYIGIGTVGGAISGKMDRVSIRTAKFAIDHSIPILGGMISGSAETFIECGSLIKNAFGAASAVLISAPFAYSFIRVAVNMLVLKAGAAMQMLFGGSPQLMERMAKLHALMLSVMASVYVMAFISTAVFMGVFA